LEEL
jgi:hypothetical protein